MVKKSAAIPTHVAIIMDGNGRWALSRGLPRLAGHRAGTENLRRIITSCVEFGIQYLTIYAFSTENWGRPREEVDGLMNILEDVIDRELAELHQEGVQLRHIGRLERLDPKIQEKVLEAIVLTKNNDRLILNVAFNYGGRDEIICAIRTSGELRVSNFLIWQGAYSEWYVTSTYWPDFDKEAFRKALETYAHRDRRYGGLSRHPKGEKT
jgi:undecaprenyl diphosphate synthase